MTRRKLIQSAAVSAAALVLPTGPLSAAGQVPSAAKLPRWRGFNLLEMFTDRRPAPFREEDFALIAEWGFDFVRLPLSYRCWARPEDWLNINEERVKWVDGAVKLGQKYRVHVNINFHRAPGYCVNPPDEPLDLWTSPEAQKAAVFHWRHFAKRYQGIPSTEVSFDLLNEPKDMPEEPYANVIRMFVEAIREVDPQRLIIADGLKWGGTPVHSLSDLGIGQSTRGYAPTQISHYKANWVTGADQFEEPTWPLTIPGKEGKPPTVYDRARLIKERIEPWKALESKGVGVHVGEWGAYNYTPHKVVLAWMKDYLELWKEVGWGWALWNLRGSFGVLNSGRKDMQYEDFRGHKLDRKMLELLLAY